MKKEPGLDIIGEDDYDNLKEEAGKPKIIEQEEEEDEEEVEEVDTEEEDHEERSDEYEYESDVSTDEEEEDLYVELTATILERRGIELNQDVVDLFIEEGGGVEGLLNVLENIKPDYSHDLVEEFDDYVSRGGNPLDWIKAQNEVESSMDLSTIEGAANAIRTYYEASTNWGNDRINKELSKLKTVEDYEDKLEEILPALENIKREKEINLFRELEEKRLREEQEYKVYVSNVNAYVANIDTVKELSIPFNQKDKKGFFNYFIQRGNDGLTQYEKEIRTDPTMELKLAMLAYKNAHKGELEKVIKNEAVNKIEKLATKQVKKTVTQPTKVRIVSEDDY